MKNYMYQLLSDIGEDNGQKIRNLIKNDVLSIDYIIKKAIETNDANILYNVAFHINNLTNEELEKIADIIIQKKDMDKMCGYAAYIKNAPIDKIVNEIIKIGDAKYIYRLSVFLKDKIEYINKLEEAIISTGNAEYIYMLANKLRNVLSEESVYKLGIAISETNDLEYIYQFAKEIKNAPIKELAYKIIKSKNEIYIQKIKEVENAPSDIDLLIERVNLEEMGEYEQLTELNVLIQLKENEKISYNKDIYRRLFVETDEEEKEIEKEIKHKKRALTKEPGQRMNSRPQFPE